MDVFTKGFVDIMAAEQSMEDTDWFQGTADAVRRCLKHFNDPAIKHIFILGGDQLYKMNFRDMYRYHIERGSEVTVACNCVDPEEVPHLGIMGMDKDARITRFVEKPEDISKIEDMAVKRDGKKKFLGSMGIYLFNKEALIKLLKKDKKTDFGKEIIPEVVSEGKASAFIFEGYWRDIGTIRSFYEENLALSKSIPSLDVFDESWQIFTRVRHLPPAKFEDSHIESSIVAEGAITQLANIKHSIIGLRFRVGPGSVIKDTIAMGSDYYETVDEIKEKAAKGIPPLGVGNNCRIYKAILDKNVRIGDNVEIINKEGHKNFDGPNYFIRDGIVIITKGSSMPSGTVI